MLYSELGSGDSTIGLFLVVLSMVGLSREKCLPNSFFLRHYGEGNAVGLVTRRLVGRAWIMSWAWLGTHPIPAATTAVRGIAFCGAGCISSSPVDGFRIHSVPFSFQEQPLPC